MVKTEDRRTGVKASIAGLSENPARGKDVLIKPNFNTADPAPGPLRKPCAGSYADFARGRVVGYGRPVYPCRRSKLPADNVGDDGEGYHSGA